MAAWWWGDGTGVYIEGGGARALICLAQPFPAAAPARSVIAIGALASEPGEGGKEIETESGIRGFCARRRVRMQRINI